MCRPCDASECGGRAGGLRPSGLEYNSFSFARLPLTSCCNGCGVGPCTSKSREHREGSGKVPGGSSGVATGQSVTQNWEGRPPPANQRRAGCCQGRLALEAASPGWPKQMCHCKL
ncbi:unnamed protein product [Gadus morhua 'NCC']